MKKATICTLTLIALFSLASCNNGSSKMDEKSESKDSKEVSNKGVKIAYIEVDSLMSQYKFCKEYSIILQKKSNNARNTLTQKGNQLQNAASNFQQKLQNNGFQSREEAERVQANLQRQQQDLQELEARLSNELNEETLKYNSALRDSLNNFLATYNKSKKYDLILSKVGDNILLADKRFDITNDVINGLNKRYKSTLNVEKKK